VTHSPANARNLRGKPNGQPRRLLAFQGHATARVADAPRGSRLAPTVRISRTVPHHLQTQPLAEGQSTSGEGRGCAAERSNRVCAPGGRATRTAAWDQPALSVSAPFPHACGNGADTDVATESAHLAVLLPRHAKTGLIYPSFFSVSQTAVLAIATESGVPSAVLVVTTRTSSEIRRMDTWSVRIRPCPNRRPRLSSTLIACTVSVIGSEAHCLAVRDARKFHRLCCPVHYQV
jgi:hypothetical protein